MTYKEFKKRLLDLDSTNKEFCEIFNLHPTTLSKSNKECISKMLETYIILLQAFGKDKVREVLVG
jgi:hypothetical protein